MSDTPREFPLIPEGKLPKGSKCYACDNVAVSIEHAPPRSWFDDRSWSIPETVPACDLHNSDNSAAVEFVACVLGALSCPPNGDKLWDRCRRSYQKGLYAKKFLDRVDGNRAITLTEDEGEKYRSAMRSVGDVLAFLLEKGEVPKKWHVVSDLIVNPTVAELKAMAQSRAASTSNKWEAHQARAPQSFQWWHCDIEGQLWLRLLFFTKIEVFLVDPQTSTPAEVTE